MPWPLASVAAVLTFVVISQLLPDDARPLVFQLVSFLVVGLTAGILANHRGLLAATLAGAVITISFIALGVAMGKTALGYYYELSNYARHFGPFVVMGLVLSPVGGVAGQALRKWLRSRRSDCIPGS